MKNVVLSPSFAPFSTNALTSPAPMPRDPPVTIATFPSKLALLAWPLVWPFVHFFFFCRQLTQLEPARDRVRRFPRPRFLAGSMRSCSSMDSFLGESSLGDSRKTVLETQSERLSPYTVLLAKGY